MSSNININVEDRRRRFMPHSGTIISPSGRLCCFLVIDWDISLPFASPRLLKKIQFIDLFNKSQSFFEFPDEKMLMINSVYWLTDHLLVFLSTDGTSFRQNMFRVDIEKKPCVQKICERVYMLPSKKFNEWRIIAARRICFQKDAYITWVDGRTENGNCTALYLIPQNPNNDRLKLRKLAMYLSTRNNPIFRKDEVMQEYNVARKGRILGSPFIRHNKLLFRICCKDWQHDEFFDEGTFLFGVFFSVDVEKLQEVKGLDYKQKDVQDNTDAYTLYKWTEMMEKRNISFHLGERSSQQIGKYLMFEVEATLHGRIATVIHLEDESFAMTHYTPYKHFNKVSLVLHPSGCILKMELDKDFESNYTLHKINKPSNHIRLEDIARRNVILNEDINARKMEEYEHLIYKV